MTPFRFGLPSRQLYGVFHQAEGDPPSHRSVLLCNAFGQESVRTHRLYRVLAERLAKSGVGVLRFDYFGTGDSAGDDEDGDLAGWREDVVTAHAELARRARSTTTIWIGARLGGTLAALASAAVPSPPEQIVLWEPVVDGADYLSRISTPTPPAPDEIRRGLGPRGSATEAIGFSISDDLKQQLQELTIASFAQTRATRVVVVTQPSSSMNELRDALQAIQIECTVSPLAHRFDWTSDDALNTAIVPAAALELLATQVEGLRA